jgi:hypothetical protein
MAKLHVSHRRATAAVSCTGFLRIPSARHRLHEGDWHSSLASQCALPVRLRMSVESSKSARMRVVSAEEVASNLLGYNILLAMSSHCTARKASQVGIIDQLRQLRSAIARLSRRGLQSHPVLIIFSSVVVVESACDVKDLSSKGAVSGMRSR